MPFVGHGVVIISPAIRESVSLKPLSIANPLSQGGAVPCSGTVSDMDVATEPTWIYSRRVQEKGTTPPWRAHRIHRTALASRQNP